MTARVVSLPARGPVLDKDLREAVVVGAAVGALVGSGTTAGVGAELRCLVFLGQWWKEYCFER